MFHILNLPINIGKFVNSDIKIRNTFFIRQKEFTKPFRDDSIKTLISIGQYLKKDKGVNHELI